MVSPLVVLAHLQSFPRPNQTLALPHALSRRQTDRLAASRFNTHHTHTCNAAPELYTIFVTVRLPGMQSSASFYFLYRCKPKSTPHRDGTLISSMQILHITVYTVKLYNNLARLQIVREINLSRHTAMLQLELIKVLAHHKSTQLI